MSQTPEETQTSEATRSTEATEDARETRNTEEPTSTEGARTTAAAPDDEPTGGPGEDDAPADARPAEAAGDDAPAGATTGAEEAPAETGPRLPASLTFRTPRVSVLAILAIAACATPLATTAGGWALLIYLLPLALLVWVLRTGTTVTGESVTARTAWGGQVMPWDDITALRVHRQSRLRAVLRSGKQVTLPAVRPRDLPRFSAMSGGRLPDPFAAE